MRQTGSGPEHVSSLIDALGGRSVVVVGDVMLDEFVFGRVDRISPEAPVPVVQFDRDEYRAGGAANVAHNVRALGGKVDLIGVIGSDTAGEQLKRELNNAGIGTDGIVTVPQRRTTRKLRVVTTRNQQVARVDYETETEIEPLVSAALADCVVTAAAHAGVIVVSDYLKGAITRELMGQIVADSRARGIPVLVDPKIPHIDYYSGTTLITPNHHETETATHMRIRTSADAWAAARAFQRQASCTSVLITHGEHGMWLLDGEPRSSCTDNASDTCERHLPAVAREVSDVTGAGDTVIATIALGLAAGARLVVAAELANYAAGIVVGKFGPATVTADELRAAIAGS